MFKGIGDIMNNKFYKDQLVNTAERLTRLADRIDNDTTPLNAEERKLFRLGMFSFVQDILQDAQHFYLLDADEDLKRSLARIIELSEAI